MSHDERIYLRPDSDNQAPNPHEASDDPGVDPADPDIDNAVCSVPLEDEDGHQYVICQQNQGSEGSIGQGEFPDPAAQPQTPAPGI